jgi:hypothetical protein
MAREMVKLSPVLKHQIMKMYEGMEVNLQSFLISALMELRKLSASAALL